MSDLAPFDPERIIPVLTDGDFGWSDGDITGNAVSPALQGAFSDEPRWVDLRFARSEEQLDLNNFMDEGVPRIGFIGVVDLDPERLLERVGRSDLPLDHLGCAQISDHDRCAQRQM